MLIVISITELTKVAMLSYDYCYFNCRNQPNDSLCVIYAIPIAEITDISIFLYGVRSFSYSNHTNIIVFA